MVDSGFSGGRESEGGGNGTTNIWYSQSEYGHIGTLFAFSAVLFFPAFSEVLFFLTLGPFGGPKVPERRVLELILELFSG